MSARYVELPHLFYVPSVERMMSAKQSTSNKQASEGGISEARADQLRKTLGASCLSSREEYEALLGAGVAREIARLVIPVNQYSRMRAGANLRNWLGFLTLRMAPNAQWEIRQYANAAHHLLSARFPRTLALFDSKPS
jgi:thymidylate synthase (FAD)